MKLSEEFIKTKINPIVAAELFGRVEQADEPTAEWFAELLHERNTLSMQLDSARHQITDLKATIARLEGEVAKAAKPKVVVELPQGSAVEFAKVWWTEWRGDDLHVCVSVDAPQPEVITGKGQAVTCEGVYATYFITGAFCKFAKKAIGDCFAADWRYLRVADIPPARVEPPTFTPPPTPELPVYRVKATGVLFRGRHIPGRCLICVSSDDKTIEGNNYLLREVELLDDAGEVKKG